MSTTETIQRRREVIPQPHKALATEDCYPLKNEDALRSTRPIHLFICVMHRP